MQALELRERQEPLEPQVLLGNRCDWCRRVTGAAGAAGAAGATGAAGAAGAAGAEQLGAAGATKPLVQQVLLEQRKLSWSRNRHWVQLELEQQLGQQALQGLRS